MNLIAKVSSICCLLIMAGCQLKPVSVTYPNPTTESEIERDWNNAQQALDLGKFAEAKVLFQDFRYRYPRAKNVEASRIAEMDSRIGMGEYAEAAELGRDIIVKNYEVQPTFSALVLYKLSFAYEAMGDEAKALSSLLDAKKMSEHLPPYIEQAEIPARLAGLYARQGRVLETNQYLDEAEKGIDRLLATSVDKKFPWLGKAYVQMGQISTNQLSAENYEQVVASQKAVQKFLLRALKLNDARWSSQALQILRQNYTAFSTQIVLESNWERKALLAGDFYDLLAEAKLYRPRKAGNTYEGEFFKYLAFVEKDTERVIFENRARNVLTPESESLNSIRRGRRVLPDGSLPERQKSTINLPEKIVPSEDPNL